MYMKFSTLVLVLAGAILSFSGCTSTTMQIVIPEGSVISRTYQTEDFSAVDIHGGVWEVVFRQSENYSATVEINENLLDHFSLSVQRGLLTASFDIGIGFDENISSVSRIYVYAPYIESLSLSGTITAIDWDTIHAQNFAIDSGGVVNIDIMLEVENIAIDVRGVANIELSGRADTADISMTGSGSLLAFDLQTRDTQINVSGAGTANIAVSENLYATANGTSRILYRGNPTVIQNISGGLASISRDN